MAKKVIALVLGALLLIGGAVLAVGGIVLMAAFGRDGTLTSPSERLATPTTALVAALDDIEGTSGVAAGAGTPALRLSVTGSGSAVFVGVGPAAAVDRYLAGSRIDRVTDLEVDPFALKTVRQDGNATPGAPDSQTFWTARASGPVASLNWKITDGSYRLVVMNADARPGVQADGRFTLAIPHLFGIGLGILIGGLILCLIGALLLVLGVRTRSRPAPSAMTVPPYR